MTGRVAFHSVTAHRSLATFAFSTLYLSLSPSFLSFFVLCFSHFYCFVSFLSNLLFFLAASHFFLFQLLFSSPSLYLNLFCLLHSSRPLMAVLKSWLRDSNTIWGFSQRVVVCTCMCVCVCVSFYCDIYIYLSSFHNDPYCAAVVKM